MCILLVAYEADPAYPLIIAANRDELYDRPASPAHWWPDAPRVLAGRDQKAGGTWLGVSREGKFAALTNHWGGEKVPADAPSRGLLVGNFLSSLKGAEEYLNEIKREGNAYAGFNLIFGSPSRFFYYTNRSMDGTGQLSTGIHCISNAVLDTPWPKVVLAKKLLAELIATGNVTKQGLFELLNRSEQEEEQKREDLSDERRRVLSRSSIRVFFPRFGTRSSTVVLYKRDGTIHFEERTYYPPGVKKFAWKRETDPDTLV